MLIKRIDARVHASCAQLIEALEKDLDALTGGFLSLKDSKLVVFMRGEVKDISVELNASVSKDGGLRIDAVNELGYEALHLYASCREEDGSASLSIELIMNPVALGVSMARVNINAEHIEYNIRRNLATVARKRLAFSDVIVDKYLREDLVARMIAEGDLVDRFETKLSELDIRALAMKFADRNLLIVFADHGIKGRAVVIGALAGVKMVYGELEYVNERAIEKMRSVGETVTVAVYGIDKFVK